MKRKYFFVLLLTIGIINPLLTYARQSENEVKLTLEDPSNNKSQTYVLKSVAYSYASPTPDSTRSLSYDNHVISMDFKNSMDHYLLEWLSGKRKEAKGTITVVNKDTGKIVKKIAFENAIGGSASENFSSGDNYGYASAQVSIYVKQLVIDGITMHSILPSSR